MSTIPPMQPVVDPSNLPRRPTTWPMVIGIIAIIIGSLGVLQYGICGPAYWMASGFFEKLMAQATAGQSSADAEVVAAQFKAMHAHLPAQLASTCTAALLSVTLLTGGIGLVRRRGWAGRTITIWGWIKMLHVPLAAYAGYVMSQDMMRAMAEAAQNAGGSASQMPPGMFQLMDTFGLIGAVIQVLFLWALPVFMLIWFARRPIRDEVASWRPELREDRYLS